MSSPSKGSAKAPVFPVGPAGRRELRRALVRSTDPSDTIQNFQKSHSLHSMMARAFGTTPRHEQEQAAAAAAQKKQDKKKKDDEEEEESTPVETLDTDSALAFLSHLGVSQHEVHKRITDTLLKQLEGEIRKIQAEGPLLDLLKSCWVYATTISELRPVLWAVLKQLGGRTPPAVLKALAEQDDNNSGELKHAEIFRPLPPLLKRLVWEMDWEDKVPLALVEESDAKTVLERVESTLLSQTILPHLQQYCSNEYLIEQANRPFVATVRDRKILTTQRRALTTVSTTTTTTTGAPAAAAAPGSTSPTRGPSSLSTLTSRGSAAAHSATETANTLNSGKSIAAVRQLLSDVTGGTASASFRPKLLYAVLTMLIAKHGSIEDNLMGCADHLHCTLVADLLLSASGLPKAYQHVLRLAIVLDDSVKAGILADTAIVKIQACLKHIFPADAEDIAAAAAEEKKSKADKKKKETVVALGKNAHDPLKEPTTAFKRQLNRIILASLHAMKDADPQNLFLKPVTDEIAPGYSKVIKQPMCIMTMEEKIDDFEYTTLQEWEDDVKLMFQNCITYNRGAAGQWFRGEANRQGKVFKEEVLPQARRLYQKEVALRMQKEEDIEPTKKRKHPGDDANGGSTGPAASLVVPLPAVYKKARRSAAAKKGTDDAAGEKGPTHIPSMPALASMLLADPFVVRLLLDRVLRSIRLDVTRGKSLPTGHSIIPSLLQLLHMAQWSNTVCAVRGKQYVVPDAGLASPPSGNDVSPEEYLMRTIPYESLRRFMPLLSQLLLENELDQRVVMGGDLHEASASLFEGRPPPPDPEMWKTSSNIQAIVGLVEGALVHICRPGNGNENSLSVTYPKFARALQEASNTLCEDRAFFLCLIQSLLRHKSKLNRNTRDVVVSHWLSYLQKPPRKRKKGSNKKQRKWGTMTSAAHECLILLLNEWASLGNLLLPRDKLLSFSSEAVQAADASETLPERKFSALWALETKKEEDKANNEEEDSPAGGDFGPIRKQYERLLTSLPENHRDQWKEQVGIAAAVMEDAVDNDTAKKDDDEVVKKEEDDGAVVKQEDMADAKTDEDDVKMKVEDA